MSQAVPIPAESTGFRRGENPNSLAALAEHKAPRWPAGISGNPGGRVKETVRPKIREIAVSPTKLARLLQKDKSELTIAENAAVELAAGVDRGDPAFIREFIEQCDGRQAAPTDETITVRNIQLVITVQGATTKLLPATDVEGTIVK